MKNLISVCWLASISRRALVLVSIGLFVGPGTGSSAEPVLSSPDQAKARKLYVSKCAKCHEFYEPRKYAEGEWTDWMARMSRKARLKEEQQKLLSEYLAQYRAGKIAATH